MRSDTRRGPKWPLILLLPLLAAGGCASTPLTVIGPSACLQYVPDRWREPVPGAEPYGAAPSVGDVIAFGDGQTAALDVANSRTADTITIVGKCEAAHAAAVAKLTKPWWKVWAP